MQPLRFNLQSSSVLPKPKITVPKITNVSNSNRTDETEPQPSSSAGKITRLVLNNAGRTKLNINPDREFYSYPRFVTHVDDLFISTLTDLFKDRLSPGSVILDLMSSWVSHLPEEVKYERVIGHGLNAQELSRNPRFDYFFVKDLNKEQKLEFEDECFDAVLCTVSIQYLQQPEKVFAEIFRVLKSGGIFIVSFSNRMFYEKAISVWRDGTEYSRVQLVIQYFHCIEGFTLPEVVRKPSRYGGSSSKDGEAKKSILSWIMDFLGLPFVSDPFYAVIAYKNFKPFYE